VDELVSGGVVLFSEYRQVAASIRPDI